MKTLGRFPEKKLVRKNLVPGKFLYIGIFLNHPGKWGIRKSLSREALKLNMFLQMSHL